MVTIGEVEIEVDSVQSFYISILEKELIFTSIGLNIGNHYLHSNDLDVLVGSSLVQCSFDDTEEGGLWNGIVYFEVAPEPDNLLVTSFTDQSQDVHGTVFEVYAWTELTVTSLDMHLDSTETEIIEVSVMDEDEWQELCTAEIQIQCSFWSKRFIRHRVSHFDYCCDV